MNTTFNYEAQAFLQLGSKVHSKDSRRKAAAKAAAILRKVALKNRNPEMGLLATSVQLDAFTKVKKAIDDMIATLKQQQEDEVKKRDCCTSSLQENEMETAKKDDLKEDLLVDIDGLTANIEKLGKAINATKAEIALARVNLQRANENRVKENTEFQRVVADQRATKEVLNRACARLSQFYDAELLQVKKQQPPAEAAHLKGYTKNRGGNGVMSMIEKLITDTENLEKESIAAEQDAQAAYETLVADTNDSVAEKEAAVLQMSDEKASDEKELNLKKESLEATMKELEELSKMNGQLHEECDYVLKNFEIRQTARQQEIEALQQAKQILSGAMLSESSAE